MNIGMILDSTFPPDPRVENEAISLIENGHQVFLYCFSLDRRHPTEEIINGIKVFRKYIPDYIYKLSALAYTLPFYHWYLEKSINHFLKNNNIAVIHIHDIQVAGVALKLAVKNRLPSVLDLHENRPEIMRYYAHVQSLTGKLLINPDRWKKHEIKFLKESTKIIVVTESARSYYQSLTGLEDENFFIVPNTVRQEFYKSFEPDLALKKQLENRFTLLYLGDTGLRRGLETAIKGVGILREQIPEIKLIVVGKNKTDHVLVDLIKKLNLQENVELTGWQPFENFPSFINACDIGISPLHKNIHHDTTYANKIFQYLSFGKPIIVSNCDAQEKIVETYNCGLVFNDRNENDFAAQVIKLYKEKELYDQLSRNAREAIENHLNWEKTSSTLISLYQSI